MNDTVVPESVMKMLQQIAERPITASSDFLTVYDTGQRDLANTIFQMINLTKGSHNE